MSKNNCVKKHEKEYSHVPKVNLFPLVGLIVFGFLSLFNFHLIVEWWSVLGLQDLTFGVNYSFVDLSIVILFFVEYLFVSGCLISLAVLLKGGYEKLNEFNKQGLINSLIDGLIFGLIIGLIIGLIDGLITGLIFGFIGGFIGGFIACLIYGLIAGLIAGFIGGFIEEFGCS